MFSSDRQESSLNRLKVSSEAKLAEEAKLDQRKKSCLVLILHHLSQHGYQNAPILNKIDISRLWNNYKKNPIYP